MKATGIVRRIDDLGRVVIPKEIRSTMGITEGEPLEIFVDGDRIIFRKYTPGCVLCGSTEQLQSVSGKLICRQCVLGIALVAKHA
ncbi:AbrB/MazE/SpoVT family DNA-binding domain-containing protein [Gorillibacterium timonense]|uniref:AbrB/MazE/SpoVT family DNA-binding domain-containing protein n=1 Tax=Gorillibacterium timonense TaxID=1689269 RepID=UPI00071CC8D8|nr:AbrB/MazE/SpoVT family DNA-binding domain-containing protein [Gorillibacterium timonense]